MRKLIIASWLVLASPCLADPVLVPIEPEPAWPIMTTRGVGTYISTDDAPAPTPGCDASAALARWAPEEPRERHRRHRRR